ncbi:MAG: hypothetical protein JEZ00_21240 [Anaerolineaceae bacterium]|nr:hypothetical protein [Anaerolineaceae bacterium]
MDKEKQFSNRGSNSIYGIVIKFYRWMVNNTYNGNGDNFDFLVWGYFDHMNIREIHSLKEFYQENEIYTDHSRNHLRFESQRLCLYSDDPNCKNIVSLDYQKENQALPLIAISELKFNHPTNMPDDNQKEYLAKSREEIIHYLQQAIDDQNATDLDFHTFSSLGYSDLVIVFRGRSYEKIMNLLKKLRHEPNNSERSIVNSTYSITGVNVKQNISVDEQLADLSIRVSLKSIRNLEYVKKKILEKLDFFQPKFHAVFGKYDLDILCTAVNPQQYIYLCGLDFEFILNPRAKEYCDFVNYTNTRWIIPNADEFDINGNGTPDHMPEKSDEQIDELINICKFIEENANLSASINSTLQRLLICFVQIIQNEVSEKKLADELHDIFLDFLSLSLWNMGIDKNGQNQIKKKGDLRKPFDPSNKIDIDSFEKGMQLIFEVIQNRVHASRMIFEMPSYNASILDTSTKISMMYSNIVNKFEESFPNRAGVNHQTEIQTNFFTLFDHSLTLETHSFFPDSIDQAGKRLISIHLNNTAFYDFKHSIPFLFHEIGHAIPPANRENRNKAYAASFCAYIGQSIMGELLRTPNYSEIEKRFHDQVQQAITNITDSVGNCILNQLWHSLQPDAKKQHFRNFESIIVNSFMDEYSYNLPNFKEIYNKAINEIFEIVEQKNLQNDSINRFLSLFRTQLDTLNNIQGQNNNIQELWNRDIQEANNHLPEELIKTMQLNWDKFNDAIDEQSERISNNIADLIANSSFETELNNIDKFLLSGMNDSDINGLLEFLSQHYLLELRKTNLKKITLQIHNYLATYWTKDDILATAKYYHLLFTDIFADYNMIKSLDLNYSTYIKVLQEYSSIQKYQPFLSNYRDAAQIRKDTLLSINLFDLSDTLKNNEMSDKKEIKTIIRNFETLIKYLLEEETIYINKLMKDNLFLSHIQENYQKFVQTIPENDPEFKSLSNEINFIESIL